MGRGWGNDGIWPLAASEERRREREEKAKRRGHPMGGLGPLHQGSEKDIPHAFALAKQKKI
jgi:hypothetical protein